MTVTVVIGIHDNHDNHEDWQSRRTEETWQTKEYAGANVSG